MDKAVLIAQFRTNQGIDTFRITWGIRLFFYLSQESSLSLFFQLLILTKYWWLSPEADRIG